MYGKSLVCFDLGDTLNINHEECIAVGSGTTDIPMFNFCSKSIAINAAEKVKEHANYAVNTDDLMDILK